MSKHTILRLAVVSTFFISMNAYAVSTPGLLGVDLEPVVGYERAQTLIPTPHSKDRLVYGARASAGFLFLAAEGEYLHGMSTEAFPDMGLSTKDTSDIAKVGLRGRIKFVTLLSIVLRAGGQAKKNRHEETVGGVTTVTDDPVVVHPYAGAGLVFRLGNNFTFSAEIVAVVLDKNNMSRNEYQTTAGFTVHLP